MIDSLGAQMTGDGCRAELFAEGYREALKAACAEDGDIWQLYANNFGPEGFDEAIDLLKTLPSDDERQRVAVYMEGLAEMKQEFAKTQRSPGSRSSGGSKPRRSRPR